MKQVQITISGQQPIDGYLDIILGTMFLSNLLISHTVSKQVNGDDITLVIDCELHEPPMGHMGVKDIPDA